MSAPRQLAFAAWLALSVPVAGWAAASVEERVAALYRPLQAEQVALSPDGEYIAYSRNDSGELAIYIMAVNRTERKFRIGVESDRAVSFSKERAPPRLRFLRWASARRRGDANRRLDDVIRAELVGIGNECHDRQILRRAHEVRVQARAALPATSKAC